MSLFDGQDNGLMTNKYGDWWIFLKVITVCGVLSLLIGILSIPAEAEGEIIRMAISVVMISFVIMLIPLLIGLLVGVLNKNPSGGFLISWIIIAGLFLLGLLARTEIPAS